MVPKNRQAEYQQVQNNQSPKGKMGIYNMWFSAAFNTVSYWILFV